MAEELLSLKWNNHQAHFVDILTFLREQEIFIDATLACGGKLYPAHKFVLSTCSDYFKQMFTKNPSKHPIVYMKDVTCRDLEALLDFMYNGEVNVPQSSLGSLIKTAEGLQIKGLAVPDDPPFSKRDHSIQKERRDKDQKPRRDKSFSPPPKRFRERDRSPLNSSASSFPNRSQSRSKSPHISSNNQHSVNTEHSKLEETLDEDSRTSIHSGVSEHSQSVNNKVIVNSQCHMNSEDNTGQSENSNQPKNSEPSPGPSGLHRTTHSKEEELDIKQEEDMGLVDLGGEDDDDWRDGDGMEGNSLEDGSVDTNMSSANAQSFSDVLLPLSDGSIPSGDPAMKKTDWTSFLQHPDPAATGGVMEVSAAMKRTPHQLSDYITSPPFGLDTTTIQRLFLDSTSSSTSSSNSLSKSTHSHTLDDVRPFPCKFCDARFKKKQHLQNHERIHTGEKYMCLLCGLAFSRLHILKHHVGRKHNVTQSDMI